MKVVGIHLIVTMVSWLAGSQLLAATIDSDICIYGGTSVGVIAAVQAAKMGKRVVVIELGKHLDGMTASGLGWTDIGNKDAIGGLSREFYRRPGKHYGKVEAWTPEPDMAWGVNQGLLDRATFEPAVRKSWAALVSCVDADGKLTHVQPIGANPKIFDEQATEVYGVGAFLLAGSEMFKLERMPQR